MYFNQAIKELSPFIEDPCVIPLIEKLKTYSMPTQPLTLSDINNLIRQFTPLQSKTSTEIQGRSLAVVGLRIMCMLTELKPVDPETDFTCSNQSILDKTRRYLRLTDTSQHHELSFFHHIPEPDDSLDFDSLVVDRTF